MALIATGVKDKNLRSLGWLFFLAGIALMIVLRGEYDSDYDDYFDFFTHIQDYNQKRFEIGWVALNLLIKDLGWGFGHLVVVVGGASVLSKYFAYKIMSPYPCISMVAYIYMYSWADLDQIRSGLSFGLTLMGLALAFKEGLTWKSLSVLSLMSGFLIHYSMIIIISLMSVAICFREFLTGKVVLLNLMIIVTHFFSLKYIASWLSFLPFSDRLIAYYVNRSELSFGPFSGTKILYSLVAIIAIHLYSRHKSKKMSLILIMIALITSVGNVFSDVGVLYIRVWGVWLNGLYAVLLAYAIQDLKDQGRGALVAIIGLIAYQIYFFPSIVNKFHY